MSQKGCGKRGPGYATPAEAMKAPREKIVYIVCIQPNGKEEGKSDYLATVDVDRNSATYCQVISRLHTGNLGDELHHTGWNVCSSCHDRETDGCGHPLVRDKLIMPALGSDRIYIVHTGTDPRAPRMHTVIEPSEMHALNCSTPHTTHCLPTDEIMISTMGDVDGNGKGEFLLICAKTLKLKGTWTKGKDLAKFGYDYWYQPYFDIMVSSEWGAPKVFKQGFNPADAADPEKYGRSLNFYSWKKKELLFSTNLGDDGIAPLEVRFLHDPKQPQGFVGCAVNSNIYRFYRAQDGSWVTEKVISVPPKKVTGWVMEWMSGLITDILLSMDDKYLYMSNWLHGDVRQYDISDPAHPKLTGQVFLGGSILNDSGVKVVEDQELTSQPDPVYVKGKRLHGSPQMLQLSLDGKRLYVSSSLFSVWDKEFYPETVKQGSFFVRLDVDTVNGGMKVDESFMVDFGTEPDGPVFAHEMRYPGGDCSSDIFLACD